MGAIHLAKNPATTPNSKHIDIRHHFIRERMANSEFKVVYIPSEEQHADFLTKSLHQGAFKVLSLNRCTRGRSKCTEIL